MALRLSPLRAQGQCALVPALTTEHNESERKERDGDNTRQLGSLGQRREPFVSLEADRNFTAFPTVSSICATAFLPHRRRGTKSDLGRTPSLSGIQFCYLQNRNNSLFPRQI